MNNLIFVGTDFKKGKGGVASVLNEYSKIFSNSKFVISTSSQGTLKNVIIFVIAIVKLTFLLKRKPKAIIHIHGSSYMSFYRKYFLFRYIRVFGNRMIYHIHGAEYHKFFATSSKRTREKISFFINKVDCVICLSYQWEIFFKEHFNPKMIKVIPNIVKIPQHMEIGSSCHFNFLFLGHISERKGIWLLLETIEELRENLSGRFKFLIGGNGEVNKLKRNIEEKKLDDVVEFIGWVSNNKKIFYLNKADAYILPSYNEGLPISVLEAMSYGLPIISTNVGGIPELLKNNVNGLLIRPGNKEELKQALNFVINNQIEFKSFGANSLNMIENHFPENVKKELIQLYKYLYDFTKPCTN